MSGWVYLIRNGADLYKIGITQNLEQRMKQLKPDEIVSTLETENYEQLEKNLHKKYKDVRIPQTEYFRLTDSQISDCKDQLNGVDSFPEFDFSRLPKSIEYSLYQLIGWPIFVLILGLIFDNNHKNFWELIPLSIFFGGLICVLAAFGYMFFDRDEELSLLENLSTGLVLLPIASLITWGSWWVGHWMGVAGFEG